ncbi:hypothetical protein MMPV_010043 [Pyropia vietnamensis]
MATEFSSLSSGTEGFERKIDDLAMTENRAYAFRLGGSKALPTVELYQPPFKERSVAPKSPAGRQAQLGVSASTLQSFPARRTDNGRLLFDAGPWLAAGFHLPSYLGYTIQFRGGAAYPQQVTFAVDPTQKNGTGGSLKVSAVSLPRRLMNPVPLDDRIGYFSHSHSWIDDYQGKQPQTWGADIFKWDLVKHPVITYYVDPSVPRSFWPAVVDGVKRWNPAFAAAGHRRPVLRAVVPSDSDWSADYAADDARYNAISFVQGNTAAAAASFKSDPRTGEILNADVTFLHSYFSAIISIYRAWFGHDREEGRVAAAGERVAGSEADYLYQFMADTTAHEVGHSLGLRHNFRGSASIPWSQLTNETFVRVHGPTTSIMDYLPGEPLPSSKEGSPPRYFASPVIGAYDVAAIRYGYTNWTSVDDARAYAESVADAGLAFATDVDEETDAFAQDFDLSASPLDVRQALRRAAQVVATAGERPAVSAVDAGNDVAILLNSGMNSVLAATKLVGATPAAKWVLQQLHPDDGLLSAATAALVDPHVIAKTASDCYDDLACLGRVPSPFFNHFHTQRENNLASLLSPSRLRQLVSNAAMTAAAGKDASHRLSVDELFASISETFFGASWAHLAPSDSSVTAGRLFRVEAQARWVATLKGLQNLEHAEAVKLIAVAELSRIAKAVAEAAGDHPENSHLLGLRLATASFVVA